MTREGAQQLRLCFLAYNVLVARQLFTVSFSSWLCFSLHCKAFHPIAYELVHCVGRLKMSTWFDPPAHAASSHVPIRALVRRCRPCCPVPSYLRVGALACLRLVPPLCCFLFLPFLLPWRRRPSFSLPVRHTVVGLTLLALPGSACLSLSSLVCTISLLSQAPD